MVSFADKQNSDSLYWRQKHTDKKEENWTTESTDNDNICIRICKKNRGIYTKYRQADKIQIHAIGQKTHSYLNLDISCMGTVMSRREEDEILKLWKSNEKKRFGEIKKELSKRSRRNYDNKQVARYLKRLVEYGSLYKYEDEHGPYYIPTGTPFVREYSLFNYFNKVRKYAVDRGLFTDKDVGLISGVTQVGFYGIPGGDSITDVEDCILGNLGYQLRHVFQNYSSLCRLIAARIKQRSPGKPYHFYDQLFWEYVFDIMVTCGRATLCFWDDIGIEELLSIVPDFMEFMDKMRMKYGWAGGRHEIRDNALDEAKELLELPSDLAKADAVPISDAELFNPDMVALIATCSPRTLEEYALHPENRIKEWWTKSDGTEFSSKEIRDIIEIEKQGIDIVETQEKQGVPIQDMCFGLEDLSEYFTTSLYSTGLNAFKIRLNDDVVARLKNWEWLLKKIGTENIDKLIELVKLRDMKRRSIR